MSTSASSKKRSTWKRLRRSVTLVSSLCNQFADMSSNKRSFRSDPSATTLCIQCTEMSSIKRLCLFDSSVASLCNQFAEMSITPGESTSCESSELNEKLQQEDEIKEPSTSSESTQLNEQLQQEDEIKEPSTSSGSTKWNEQVQQEDKIKESSTSSESISKSFKYDVFLSFRGDDTRKNFVDHLYHALKDKGIYTYKDDENIKQGKRISDELIKAIEDSRFYIIVFSKNYASSSWCLEELVKIMECQKITGHTAYPVFYDVEPTEVRKQSGVVGEAFAKHEKEEGAGKWREALKEASDLAGWELKNILDGHEAKFLKKIVQEISLELRSINFGFDEKLIGMKTRVKDVVSSLEVGTNKVRMIGIKGIGGGGKTTTARAVFDHLSVDFEAKCFVGNVREVSNASMFGLKKLQEQVLSKVLNGQVILDNVDDGKNMMKRWMCGKKVLLVLDDVDHTKQLEALAGDPKWFKPGSRILITTRDEHVLKAHRSVDVIRDIALLSDQEATSLFSRYAFGRENPLQGYKALSEKVVRYAAGLPLTVEVLGSFLCGKDKLEWVDAIDRLAKIPLKETLDQLELSYRSLEDDYKEIFLDIVCMLKRKPKADVIRILESCGYNARIGLKVLEQRSLITFSKYKDPDEHGLFLGMHDHIEEMGKNIVRRLHPSEPNEHSRLWIKEEIEDILANDMGTEATRCLRLDMWRGNSRILFNGLRKMKKLRYLEVEFAIYDAFQKKKFARYVNSESDGEHLGSDPKFDNTSQYFANSLKYLKCMNYPFLYLPKTFQATNLVGLDMYDSRMVEFWEEGETKVLKKLKFLSFFESKLKTFDFRITPNLQRLILQESFKLVELCMHVRCQKLNYLYISYSKVRTFDVGLTPNLETLCLVHCADFVELQVSRACPNLKSLDLSFSRLRNLDLELIPNLEKLDLANCDKLVEINPPVGCQTKLVYLNLDGCLRLKYVSLTTIHSNLPANILTFLTVNDGDRLEKLPENLVQLECLEALDLRIPDGTCLLKRLTTIQSNLLANIFMFKHLTSLTVNDGDLLEKLPENLGQLECLEALHLRSKKIDILPDSICLLKRLKCLILDHFALLEKLPENLGQLKCLESLDVRSKKIKILPDSICLLKRLKYLILDHCTLLEKLPEDLGRLECLEELVITDTGIRHLPESILGLKGLFIDSKPR